MTLNRNSSSVPSVSEQFATPTDGIHTISAYNAKIPPKPPQMNILQYYASQLPEPWITPLCGAGAGVASGFVTCPLDVIKTKLQAQGGFQARRNGKLVPSTMAYSGMSGTAKMIWQEEGLRGMYRGLGPMLLGYLPTWAVYLTVYDRSREYFYVKCGPYSEFPHLPSPSANNPFRKLVASPRLRLPNRRHLLHRRHKSHLGNKNPPHVPRRPIR
jgi:solute carrier family 25 (mitochondrial folate transporter), member 32